MKTSFLGLKVDVCVCVYSHLPPFLTSSSQRPPFSPTLTIASPPSSSPLLLLFFLSSFQPYVRMSTLWKGHRRLGYSVDWWVFVNRFLCCCCTKRLNRSIGQMYMLPRMHTSTVAKLNLFMRLIVLVLAVCVALASARVHDAVALAISCCSPAGVERRACRVVASIQNWECAPWNLKHEASNILPYVVVSSFLSLSCSACYSPSTTTTILILISSSSSPFTVAPFHNLPASIDSSSH